MLDQEKPVISSTRVCNFCETIEAPHILAKPTEKHAERRAEQRTDPAAVVLYVTATVFTHSKKKNSAKTGQTRIQETNTALLNLSMLVLSQCCYPLLCVTN